jgi:hypothetical protein
LPRNMLAWPSVVNNPWPQGLFRAFLRYDLHYGHEG